MRIPSSDPQQTMTWKPQESLLQDTILVLKQRQGASLAQIRKLLEQNNSDGGKNKMPSSTLMNLVLKGKVEKNGGLYKLARGNPAEQEGVPSRRHRAFPHGPCKSHRRYHKLRRRRGHRHRRRRRRSRRRHAYSHGRGKRHKRYQKLRRRKGHRHRR